MTSPFHSNLKHLNNCREKLNKRYEDIVDESRVLLESISLKDEETVRRIRNVQPKDATQASTYPQQQRLDGSVVRTIDCLYEAAQKIQPTFQELISNLPKAIDADPSVELKFVSLKDTQRTEAKLKTHYIKRIPGPTCAWIYDVVRCSVICYTPEQIRKSVLWLEEHAKVIKMKNRFATPAFNGYRDILIHAQIENDGCMSHVCEVQLHLTSIWELAGHLDSYVSYQYFRNLFSDGCKSQCIQDLNTIFPIQEENINKRALNELTATCKEVSRLWTCAKALNEYFGQFDLAFPLLERALVLQTERKDLIGSGITWEKMANIRLCQGDLEEAMNRYECALDVQNEALGEDHPHVGMTLNHIANILAEEENADEALQYYQLAIDIQEQTLGSDHPEVAASLLNMASILQSQGQLAEAMHKSKRALKIFQTYLKVDHHYIMDTLVNMATVRYSQDQLEESIELYQQALEIIKKSKGAKSFQVADIYYKMATTERDAGNRTEALKLFDSSLSIYTEMFGVKHPKSISAKRQVERLRYTMKEDELDDYEESVLSVKKKFQNDECVKRRCIIS